MNFNTIHPSRLLAFGYLSYMIAGWILLSLPFVQTNAVAAIDSLFIAVSAVSTTGLVTIDPGASFNFGGELVILILFQLGGIGYMTFSSFVILSISGKVSRARANIVKNSFALPDDFRILHFVRNVIVFTLVAETLGATVLYFVFSAAGVESALWHAIFHAVSAFCTAGFSLNPNSLEDFVSNPALNFTVATLSYLGAIGFIVWVDLWENVKRRRRNLTFTTRIILTITFWFSIAGTLLLFTIEPSIQGLPAAERLLAAFFQIMTASTTVGFNTVPIGGLSISAILFMYLLMIFGASPAGTGGGLKSTTLSALIAMVRATLRGRSQVTLRGRVIPDARLYSAAAAFAYYMFVAGIAIFLLGFTEDQAFETLVFETLSALGTVGLSMGATGDLTTIGRLIVIALMIMGRVGIVTFGIALAVRGDEAEDPGESPAAEERDLIM